MRAVSIITTMVAVLALVLKTEPALMMRTQEGEMIDHPFLAMVVILCLLWFAAEYVLRFIGKLEEIKGNTFFTVTVNFLFQLLPANLPLSLIKTTSLT